MRTTFPGTAENWNVSDVRPDVLEAKVEAPCSVARKDSGGGTALTAAMTATVATATAPITDTPAHQRKNLWNRNLVKVP
jgi:hypothetical protein